jgi:NTP pyrophosphatase (non-canonical NTP hydrolase)
VSDFLDRLREQNLSRVFRWHPPETRQWLGPEWANAMQGEAGEAGNVAKKLQRAEDNVTGNRDDEDRAALLDKLADEIADTLIYLDLLAAHYGINIASATTRKFDEVSIREGFPERLGTETDYETFDGLPIISVHAQGDGYLIGALPPQGWRGPVIIHGSMLLHPTLGRIQDVDSGLGHYIVDEDGS